jgi:hypothetical protein
MFHLLFSWSQGFERSELSSPRERSRLCAVFFPVSDGRRGERKEKRAWKQKRP